MLFSVAKEEAKKIIAKMTIEEKASQLIDNSSAIEHLQINKFEWWNEACHGVARSGTATVFPQAIAMAATFNEDLIHSIGDVVSTEGRAIYNKSLEFSEKGRYKGITFWAPNINIFRDPRWGRGQETYGECPFLTATLGSAYIKGIQGNDDFIKAGACAKHFAVHSGPETTRRSFNSITTEKDLWETYLPAFYWAVKSGVIGVMSSYNALNGIPTTANKMLIKDILRNKWNFNGYFCSDCGAIDHIHLSHHFVETIEEAVAAALKSGCNLSVGGAYNHLMNVYNLGLISEEDIDEALVWLYTVRYMLGDFEKERPFSDIPYSVVDCTEHRELNLKASRESIVLLENKNGFLPLNPNETKKIAIIGPNALSRTVLEGNYCGLASEYVTLSDGIRRVFKNSDIRVSEGCPLYRENPSNTVNTNLKYEAAKLSEFADLTILCVGYDSTIEGESHWDDTTVDELLDRGDRRSLKLPKTQLDMIDLVCERTDNIIVIIMGGGCIDIGEKLHKKAKAVLHAWYPGAQGGLAVAQLLAGEYSPCGKLPITFYNDIDSLPQFTDYSMDGRTYRYIKETPRYPFGYGLTYTKTVCEDFKIVTENEENIILSVKIANIGNFDVVEKLQVYAKFTDSRTTTPNYQLCAIKPVDLKQGEEKEIELTVNKYWLKAVDENGNRIVPNGKINLYIGTQQPDKLSEQLCGNKCLSIQIPT